MLGKKMATNFFEFSISQLTKVARKINFGTRIQLAPNICHTILYYLATFSINYDQEAETRRLRRHTISSPPTAAPRCHICDRICASDFGLRSHLRIHNRPSSTSQHSVIVDLDGLLQASKQANRTKHSLQVKVQPSFGSQASELQTYWRIVQQFDAVLAQPRCTGFLPCI